MVTGAGAIFFLMVGSLVLGLAFVVGWVVLKILQALLWVLRRVGCGVGWGLAGVGRLAGGLVLHVSRFVRSELVDGVHTVGALLTAAVITPLAVLNAAMGRWSAARHYGTALEDEIVSACRGFYRVVLGNPIRLVGLSALTEGIERRVPGVIDRAPRGSGRPSAATFPGYKIVDTLPGGGSGARLYVARPSLEKLSELSARGHADPGKVVIKSFALEEGSTLPEIVRETRALEAASRLGLVLEHELAPRRFHYVMPFVPGEDLGRVTSRMHAHATPQGLGRKELALVMSYAADVLRSLHRFHTNGLWHKDVKPTNLIVSDGRVHVVDLGLVTPLQSAMTLTTHGTEYYRDPEMVRLALRGVKVHEVDGVKFDLYSAGAVLYSMLESSFPAHGSLSRITKRCPEALAWIVRRAMADLATRYGSAREMLVDLETLVDAEDPFAVRPADLPSVRGALGDDALAAGAPPPRVDPFEPLPLSSESPGAAASIADAPVESGRTRRRGRNVAAAALLVASAAFAARAIHEHRERSAPAFVHYGREDVRGRSASRHAHVEAGAASRTDDATIRTAALAAAWNASLGEVMERPRAVVRDGWARPARALVVETPRGLVGDDSRDALESALAARGYEVLGAGEAGEDLVAHALHAIALGDPGDAEALARLQAWLDGEEELECVVWLARSGDGRDVGCVLDRRRDASARESRGASASRARTASEPEDRCTAWRIGIVRGADATVEIR